VVHEFPIVRPEYKGVDNLTSERIGAEDYFRFAG